jgi:hypothetical protein
MVTGALVRRPDPMIGRLLPKRRRAASAPGAAPLAVAPDAAVAPADAVAGEQPTVVQPAVADPQPTAARAPAVPAPFAWEAGAVLPPPDPAVPAGLELQPPADVPPAVPSFRTRGRLRRRLRYLRRVRELGFRDLGGLTFDLHRFGREGQALIQAKLEALVTVDTELRALERALGDERDFVDLREPGIAACPRCAALHGSDAHFCPSCGLHLDGPMALAEVAGDATPTPAPAPAPAEGDGVSAAQAGSSPVSSGLGPLPPAESAAPAGTADRPAAT